MKENGQEIIRSDEGKIVAIRYHLSDRAIQTTIFDSSEKPVAAQLETTQADGRKVIAAIDIDKEVVAGSVVV